MRGFSFRYCHGKEAGPCPGPCCGADFAQQQGLLSLPPSLLWDLSLHLEVEFPPWGDLLRAFFSNGQSLLM